MGRSGPTATVNRPSRSDGTVHLHLTPGGTDPDLAGSDKHDIFTP
jgi:hypothetical protein